MIAVQLSGGLGNQMFEYALYLKLRSLGKNVKIDDFTCYGEGERSLQLGIFGIGCAGDAADAAEDAGQMAPVTVGGGRKPDASGTGKTGDTDDGLSVTHVSHMLRYDRLTRQEYIDLTDSDLRLQHKIRRKLTGRKNFSYREYSMNFDPEIFDREPALFLGCFQTEKYFADIREQVREAYRFRNLRLSEAMKDYDGQIAGCTAVSVHIRRGDYLDPKYSALYAGICDEAYYERAIGRMKELVPDAKFFFFSNDTAWVKEHYSGPDYVTVEGNDEDTGYADMYLMSRCRHHIIANSSFSWWGAWLNADPHKKVIAPGRWLNRLDCDEAYAREECRDIYTEEMIRM